MDTRIRTVFKDIMEDIHESIKNKDGIQLEKDITDLLKHAEHVAEEARRAIISR